MSERKKRILRAVIEEHIETAEPVGSKAVRERAKLECSSATIRNELASLCSSGYLEQPHTSAGRIPTAKGYRLYVNELMYERELTTEEMENIRDALTEKNTHSDNIVDDLGQVTSRLTDYPAVTITSPISRTVKRFDLLYIDANTFIIVLMLSDDKVCSKLVRLPFSFTTALLQRLSAVFNAAFTDKPPEMITSELLRSAEQASGDNLGIVAVIAQFMIETMRSDTGTAAQVSGGENLLKLPEYKDPHKAHELMSFLGNSENLADLPAITGDGNVKVIIGPENIAEELKNTSVVLASYDAGDNTRGLIGVVGPTRMDYSNVAAKLSYIAELLSRLLNTQGSAPAGFGKLMIKGDEENDEEREE